MNSIPRVSFGIYRCEIKKKYHKDLKSKDFLPSAKRTLKTKFFTLWSTGYDQIVPLNCAQGSLLEYFGACVQLLELNPDWLYVKKGPGLLHTVKSPKEYFKV